MFDPDHIFKKLDPYKNQKAVAVGVSGGADSMALARLLSLWSVQSGVAIHVLSVDHGLRVEAAAEVMQVADAVSSWGGVVHQILCWEGEKPDTRIQEAARVARYDLMADYCAAHGITHLFLAHHQDDQAETFLFRLAKGSGLNGLAGMAFEQARGDLTLVRPLLDVAKEDLIVFSTDQNIPFIDDPSNFDTAYARVRLRNARAILEEEGLSSKRLALTAQRILRARQALDEVSDERFDVMLIKKNTDRIVFQYSLWHKQPEDIALRLIVRVFEAFFTDADYLPRMERIEDLCAALHGAEDFRKRTLGGVIFERDDQADELIMHREHETKA